MIPFGEPSAFYQVHKSEIVLAIKRVLDSRWYVLGNEVEGVSEQLIKMCDIHAEIPMRGIKQSLNVATAAGIIGYEVLRYYTYKANQD